jgi:cytochrome c oxidase accessory protein FixG
MYMCPYARFQSVMFDRDTLVITYDAARGEPRGARSRTADYRAAGLGACVDCSICVQVCPTGIDIRNGMQYECIGCAACIDACDSIMEEVGQPNGLVRYTTLSALEGNPKPILRARTFGYGAVLALVAGVLAYGLASRVPVDLDVIHDRARLYREVSHSQIENVYTLKIMNKSQDAAASRVAVGAGFSLLAPEQVEVAAGELEAVPVQVRAERDDIRATSMPLTFAVESVADPRVRVERAASFLAPASAVHGEEDDD